MPFLIRYVERKPSKFVSIERVFREIAANLSPKYLAEFDQLPFSSRVHSLIGNLIFFRQKTADIYHITGHIHFIALRLPTDRTVLTIHDVRFLHEHAGLKRAILKKLYLEIPVRRLKHITAISRNVRDEVVLHTGCDPRKIQVIENPLLTSFDGRVETLFNATKPRILQIGTLENKNLGNLTRALNGVSCRLVIVGELGSSHIRDLRDCNIEYENVSQLTDDEIVEYYRQADLITFCSTYEGFGLPIIEAQAMRKPVVTSNISPMKDTAGDGACLVDPCDPKSIREGIEKVIHNEKYRSSIIEAGIRNVTRFAPSIVSKQYENLYDEILGSRAA